MSKLSRLFAADHPTKHAAQPKIGRLVADLLPIPKKRAMALPDLVLLDRDGVINVNRPESVKSKSELTLIPGSAAAIARLNQAGVSVAIVTNQSVVGRGLITDAQLAEIHDFLKECLLAEASAHIDRIYYAPDAPDAAGMRRKPRPGMLLEALADFKISAKNCVMIGDSMTDFEAAYAAGCRFHLVRTGHGAENLEKFRQELSILLPPGRQTPKIDHFIHADLAEAVQSLFGEKV